MIMTNHDCEETKEKIGGNNSDSANIYCITRIEHHENYQIKKLLGNLQNDLMTKY